jgi:hypothetical protein
MDGSVLLIVVLVGVAVWFCVRSVQLAKARSTLASEKSRLEQRVADAEREQRSTAERVATLSAQYETLAHDNAALAKYRPLVEIERTLQQTRAQIAAESAQAQQLLEDQRRRANDAVNAHMTRAGDEAGAIVQQARDQASALGTEASSRLVAAHAAAENILRQARERAEETAGEALTAKRNLDMYRSEATALKNRIEGYGHEYVVPAHSLLDDLAEEFGFAEAGERLKAARLRTRQLVKDERAAACDYVEANRRETAVAFVIDAFNGKVDSVMARVKADNAGTLHQEILDAHALVNLNGRAFRNARIERDYLDSRLDELRWAGVAQELKNTEREEQRRVKEQIREEEKGIRCADPVLP